MVWVQNEDMTKSRTAKLSATVGPTIGSQIRTGTRKFETVMDEYDDGTYVTYSFSLDVYGTPVDGDCITLAYGESITWRDKN